MSYSSEGAIFEDFSQEGNGDNGLFNDISFNNTLNMFRYIDTEDLENVALVSKWFRDIVDSKVVWEERAEHWNYKTAVLKINLQNTVCGIVELMCRRKKMR